MSRHWAVPSDLIHFRKAEDPDAVGAELQATYLPNVASVVRLGDEARERGHPVLRGLKSDGNE